MSSLIQIKRRLISGRQSGPHLVISGGVHGDEYEPMAAIRVLMNRIEPENLSGKVTLVPLMNEPAFANRDRVGPDGLDLARTFPGDPNGSVTQRIACAGGELIAAADYFIDLHTGGRIMTVAPMSGYMLHPDAMIVCLVSGSGFKDEAAADAMIADDECPTISFQEMQARING